MSEAIVVLTTFPDRPSAEQAARALVEGGLAACVNVLPEMTSIYRWQGALQQDSEHQLVIKTVARRLADIDAWLRQHHPYELPELVALPVQGGSRDYLNWLETSTHG